MGDQALHFDGRCVCFTGTLNDLKRSHAQREARARGAMTINVVNDRLDYLVVGSIPSPGWKHGSYGRKIEKARELRAATGRPAIVAESTFMEALARTAPIGSGAIDEKVFVGNFKFLVGTLDEIDAIAFEECLNGLQRDLDCHVSVRTSWAAINRDLFGDDSDGRYQVVEIRFVRHMDLETPAQPFADSIERALERVDGADGHLAWFERQEGSADFVRLIREIPQRTRLTSD